MLDVLLTVPQPNTNNVTFILCFKIRRLELYCMYVVLKIGVQTLGLEH
jgi:hypothetical protein